MSFLAAFWLALLLDALLGDPRWLLHPVQAVGWLILRTEHFFRDHCRSETWAGLALVLLVLGATVGVTGLSHGLAVVLGPAPGLALGTWILYQSLALAGLAGHARAVYQALRDGDDLDQARRKVGLMVGRDTGALDEAGIVRACVESIGENMSDGVVAPAFYAFSGAALAVLLGAEQWQTTAAVTAAMGYKAINTMDSMLGYRNARYQHFGRVAARLDDLANLLPARISGLALVVAALPAGGDCRAGLRVMLQDHGNHASPNGGYPEAAMAGTLGIILGGTARYFGEVVHRPEIGAGLGQPHPRHILQALRLLYWGTGASFLLFSLLFLLLAP